MANPGERITHVHCTNDALVVSLADGRSISVPLAWYPRLLEATRQSWRGFPLSRHPFQAAPQQL